MKEYLFFKGIHTEIFTDKEPSCKPLTRKWLEKIAYIKMYVKKQ